MHLLAPNTRYHFGSYKHIIPPAESVIISKIEEGVCIFDKSKLTCLATHWSKDDIG